MRLRGLIQGIFGTSYQGIVLIRLVLSDTLFSGFKETLLASLMATSEAFKRQCRLRRQVDANWLVASAFGHFASAFGRRSKAVLL
ncbi:zinc finger CCCH domain-containing protein [Trifolium repens]|nr:zinc finger CCCH domain-containing protein [Trifolium repens]